MVKSINGEKFYPSEGYSNCSKEWLPSTSIRKLCRYDEYLHEEESIMTDLSETLIIPEKIHRFQEAWENESIDNSSSIIDDLGNIPKIRDEEIYTTKLLGRGAFADVHEACSMENPNQTYAIKRLRSSVLDESDGSFGNSLSDLAYETSILSSLKHENIIHLHGIKEGNTIKLLRDGEFFLALEILDETLHARYKKWQRQWSREKLLRRSLSPNTVITRLENVVMGIVSAMQFLHSNRIIYRDIKPLNIGFDKKCDVKIFDFGFARLCNKQDRDRLMTGGVGTPRYMAPEVASYDEHYSFPADVYSFSVMLWQIVTSQTPFTDIKSVSKLTEKVTIANKRPNLSIIRSEPLKALIESGWSANPIHRPSFKEIERRLGKIIAEHHLSKHSSLFYLPNFYCKKISQTQKSKSTSTSL